MIGPELTADDKIKKLQEALRPFAGFGVWVDAAAEMGEVDPIDDNAAVCSISVAGGSNYIWMHQLREALRVLEEIA